MTNDSKTMTELDGSEIYPEWDSLMGGTPVSKNTADTFELSLDNLMDSNGESTWIQQFQKLNLPGMQLIALHLPPVLIQLDLPTQNTILHITRHHFLMTLPETHFNDLRIAGLTDDEIDQISKGIIPVNWTIHLKYPPKYGGTIDVNNMVLIAQHPFHEQIHQFLNQQMITDAGIITPPVLYVPTPDNTVYVPIAGETDDSTPKHITLEVK